MIIIDPISDMLTRIRNALLARKSEVVLPYSQFKQKFAELFEQQGWLRKIEVLEEQNFKALKLTLRYDAAGEPVIRGLKRVSKPGQRIYAGAQNIPSPKLGFGVTIVSTSRGLMTDRQARKEKVGGEIICQIW